MVSRYERREPSSQPPKEFEPLGGNFRGQNILSMDQFDPSSIETLFSEAQRLRHLPRLQQRHEQREMHAVLYFNEPSTRTRDSFISATILLGGNYTIKEHDTENDTESPRFERHVISIGASADILVMRHRKKGSPAAASQILKNFADVPVINAGDGGKGEHPTQALGDMLTISEQIGRLDNLTGVIARDLKHGRTIRSLIKGLTIYPENTLYLLSPNELRIPSEELMEYRSKGIKLIEISNERDIPPNADFWYWTRIQEERFESKEELETVRDCFLIDEEFLEKHMGPQTILMHPLPRLSEIKPGIDGDPRAVYFDSQLKNNLHVRMALLSLVSKTGRDVN